MSVKVKVRVVNYPGLSQIEIDFGLGRAPKNTTNGDIANALEGVKGVVVGNVGTLRAHEGIWGINRTVGHGSRGYSPQDVAKVKAVAEEIARKG
jgi:hypothetical protein